MKVKLILSFAIILLALLTIGYFGQNTINKLIVNIKEESSPNIRLEKLKDLQSNLNEVENSVRTFTITRDPEDLTTYYRMISPLDARMNDIYNLSMTASDRNDVDEIGKWIDEKLGVLNKIINLSDDDRVNEVLQKVLEELEEIEEVPDTAANGIIGSESENEQYLQATLDSVITDSQIEEPKYGFFKKLFGSKKRKKDTKKTNDEIESPVKLEEKNEIADFISTDSADANFITPHDTILQPADTLGFIISDYDSLMPDESVEGIIQKIESEEEQLSRIRMARELKLIRDDKSISDKISNKISSMESMEELRSRERALNAETSVHKTQQIILITMISAIVVFMVLLAIILHDIARLYRQRTALKEASIESNRLATVKQEFLSNVSHEIRTPLTAIIGFAEQLEGTQLQVDQAAHLHKIIRSSEHLMMLINDILDLSKIEKGKLDLESTVFSPSNEINETIALLKTKALEKNLELRTDINGIDEMVVKGDSFRFRQIFINLLSNAIKFTEKGKIEIASQAYKDGANIRIKTTIKDTGIGISDDHLPRIFEYFTQADRGSSKQYGGSGLGLSIAKNLVEIQDGYIGVKSKVGRGSEFTFEIPYQKGNKEELPGKRESQIRSPMDHSSRHLLVVDDNKYNLELMSAILDKSKIQSTTASSGWEAMEHLRTSTFDAVLMDIQMPGMSGYDVIKLYQEEQENVDLNFIAVTADPEPDTILKLKKAGFIDVISKPFTQKTLFQALDHILTSLPLRERIEPKDDDPGSLSSKPYQLNSLLDLSEGDKVFQINMIELFLKNTDEHLSKLNEEIKTNDYKSAASIAHKAIPSCKHLNIVSMVDKLKLIEQTCKQQLPDIPGINFQALEYEWKTIRQMLEKELEEIKLKLKDESD